MLQTLFPDLQNFGTMKKALLQTTGAIALLIFTLQAKAQEQLAAADKPVVATTTTGETAEAEAAAEEESKLPFEISGFVDVYYQYSLIESPVPTSFTEAFNTFSLGMANLAISKDDGKVGFMIDLGVGPRAEVANGFTGTTLSAIKQLYVTYAPSDWLKLTAGNFSTFVGYELIDAPLNVNYSMSYMFSYGPFYHTGLKADFTISESFGAMVGIFNDTDSKFDFTEGKHFGAQLSFTKGDFAAYLNYLGGKNVEADSIIPSMTGHQVDLTATFQATEKFGLGLNTTMRNNDPSEGEATSWFGAALYANYAFSDAFTFGFRGEYLGDSDGLILGATDGSVLDLTFSGNIKKGPLTIIPEFRIDLANKEVFTDASNGGKFTKTAPMLLLAAVYSF